jgi:hypothetical protein
MNRQNAKIHGVGEYVLPFRSRRQLLSATSSCSVGVTEPPELEWLSYNRTLKEERIHSGGNGFTWKKAISCFLTELGIHCLSTLPSYLAPLYKHRAWCRGWIRGGGDEFGEDRLPWSRQKSFSQAPCIYTSGNDSLITYSSYLTYPH